MKRKMILSQKRVISLAINKKGKIEATTLPYKSLNNLES